MPWVMAWLQSELEGMFVGVFVWVSLSLLNGGIFPNDDIPEEFKRIVEEECVIKSNSGSDWESTFSILAVMNQSPTGPLYTLMLVMRNTWLRDGEGNILFGDGYPMGDHSSVEDCLLPSDVS